MKPIIGITPSIGTTEDRGDHFRMEVSYVEAIERAGGVPVLLPPQQGGVDELLTVVDGVLFSGGGDIDPARYGDREVHAETYGISALRDEFEFALLDAALRRDLPVLAICRGIQVLNVGLGGTLYQDVADQFSDAIVHRQPWDTAHWRRPFHPVALEADSLAADVFAGGQVGTNSAHHQTLKDVAPGLRVTGRSDDGSIEAVERPESRFVLGVQWHPEKMFDAHPEHLRPFARLVAEAVAYREQRALGAAAD